MGVLPRKPKSRPRRVVEPIPRERHHHPPWTVVSSAPRELFQAASCLVRTQLVTIWLGISPPGEDILRYTAYRTASLAKRTRMMRFPLVTASYSLHRQDESSNRKST